MNRYGLTIVVGVLFLLSFSYILWNGSNAGVSIHPHPAHVRAAPPTSTRQVDLVVNGTTETISTSVSYNSITVTNGGTLEITGATVSVEQFIYANESSTVIITDSQVTVGGGDVSADGKYFIAEDCNKVVITSSDITVQGTDSLGALGQYEVYGGDGDRAVFKVDTTSYRLDISESTIRVLGGDGGDGGDGMDNGGGTGGDGGDGGNGGLALAIFNTTTGDVTLSNTVVECIGGDGGPGGDYGEGMDNDHNGQAGTGGNGGESHIYLNSKSGVVLMHVSIKAKGGNGGRGGLGYDYGGTGGDWGTGNFEVYAEGTSQYGYSVVIQNTDIRAERGDYGRGGVYMAEDGVNGEDGNNGGSDQDKSSIKISMKSIDDVRDSTLITSEYTLRNIGTSNIVVNMYNSTLPNSTQVHFYFDGEIEINVIRTLTVKVITEKGEPLAGVSVSIENDEDSSIKKSGQTDSKGEISLEAPGRRIYLYGPSVKDKTQSYKLDVTYRSETRSIKTQLNSDKVETIEMPVISVGISSVVISGVGPPQNGKVGGVVMIYGNTTTPYTDKGIQSVYVGITPAESTAQPQWHEAVNDGGDWSSWHFEWDTLTGEYDNGMEYNVTVWATDDYLDDYDYIHLVVDQDIINHPPELSLSSPANNTEIKVYTSGGTRSITLSGTVSDEDYGKGEGSVGAKVTRLEARILDESLNPIPGKGNWFTIDSTYKLALNWSWDSGEGEWSFSIDGVTEIGEEGDYWIFVRAYDGKAYSNIETVKFSLRILSPPTLVVKHDGDRIVDYDTVDLEIDPQNNKKAELVIDLGDSLSGMPGGSPYANVIYAYIEWGDGESTNQTLHTDQNATLSHVYKPKISDEYKEQIDRFNVSIFIKNQDGLESKKIEFEVKVTYHPLPEPVGGVLDVIPKELREPLRNSLIALVLLMNVLGPLLIIFKSSSEKKRIALEKEKIQAQLKAKAGAEKAETQSIYAMEMGTVREGPVVEAAPPTVSAPSYESPVSTSAGIYEPTPVAEEAYEDLFEDIGPTYEEPAGAQSITQGYPTPQSQVPAQRPTPPQSTQQQVSRPTITIGSRGSPYSQSVYHSAPGADRGSAIYQSQTRPSSPPSGGGMRCPKCGAPVQLNWVMCPKCFAKLK